ncbi:MAG: hypothetical protein ABSF10_20230 [Verrucomicrobiota bacterium]|jgi:hypothetical protein
MRIISLDQNVISYLVKNDHESFWQDLREKLLAGVKAGKLLCPIPKETIFETIPCSRDVRIKIRDLQHELSLGFSFKPFGVIEGEETLALVRPSISTFPYERIVWHSVEDDALAQAKAKEIRDAQGLMRQQMDVFVASPGQDKLTVKEIRSRVIASRAGSFYRQIERLLADQPLDPADDLQFELCRYLVSRCITKAELEQLREKILMHEWEAIPLIFFAAALGALLDHGRAQKMQPRKYDVNDETDICRIAIALHSSAMIIMEKSMAYLVKQLEKEWGESLDVLAINEHEAIKANLEMAMTE